MQNAIAKLYIAIFLFFGDAITWYNSSSRLKMLNSLHNDFSEKFRTAVDKIKQLADSVQHIAKLGSEAEVRVIRLDLEDLQHELQDARVGLQGQLRFMAELVRWQHGENLEQHRQTQALLAEMRSTTAANSVHMPQLIGGQQHILSADSEDFNFLDVVSPNSILPLSRTPETRTLHEHSSLYSNSQTIKRLAKAAWLARQLNDFPSLRADQAPATNLHESQISKVLNHWLASTDRSLLYLECSSSHQNNVLPEAAAQILQLCQSSKYPVAAHYSSHATLATYPPTVVKGSSVVDLMLNLAYQIIELLPEDSAHPTSYWKPLVELDVF
jgi:hypothetical protein